MHTDTRQVDTTASPDVEPKNSRREFAALLGAFSAFALGCADGGGEKGTESLTATPDEMGQLFEALTGNGVLKIADTAASLRTISGGTTLWLAALQGITTAGDNGAGLYYWSATALPDDGFAVLNLSAGNVAGWRRLSPGAVVDGRVTTTLSARKGVRDSELVTTTGYATAGDGGGMTFRFALGASSGADGFIKINASNGQWQALDPFQRGYADPRWFGATGGDNTITTSSQAAFDALRTFTTTSGNPRKMYLPPLTFVAAFNVPTQYVIEGANRELSVLKAPSATGGSMSGVLEIDATFQNITLENFTVFGAWDTWTKAGASTNRRHGISVHPAGDSFGLRLHNVKAMYCTGSGIFFDQHVFQSDLSRVDVLNTGTHSFDIYGNNTIKLECCNGYMVPVDSAMIRMRAGAPTIDTCNGLFFDSTYVQATDRVSWGHFGDSTIPAYCKPTIVNCNIEDYTAYGCYFESGSLANFRNTRFTHANAAVVRALYYEGVPSNALADADATVDTVGAGPYGDPVTQTADGVPVYAAGLPFYPASTGFANLTQASGSIVFPKRVWNQVSYLNYTVEQHRQSMVHPFAKITNVIGPTTYSVVDDDTYLLIDTTAGAVTINLPDTTYNRYRIIYCCKSSGGTNNITLGGSGGQTVNGSTTYVWNTAYTMRTLIGGVDTTAGTNWGAF